MTPWSPERVKQTMATMRESLVDLGATSYGCAVRRCVLRDQMIHTHRSDRGLVDYVISRAHSEVGSGVHRMMSGQGYVYWTKQADTVSVNMVWTVPVKHKDIFLAGIEAMTAMFPDLVVES